MKKLVETLRQENEDLKSDSKYENLKAQNVIMKNRIDSIKKEKEIMFYQLKDKNKKLRVQV